MSKKSPACTPPTSESSARPSNTEEMEHLRSENNRLRSQLQTISNHFESYRKRVGKSQDLMMVSSGELSEDLTNPSRESELQLKYEELIKSKLSVVVHKLKKQQTTENPDVIKKRARTTIKDAFQKAEEKIFSVRREMQNIFHFKHVRNIRNTKTSQYLTMAVQNLQNAMYHKDIQQGNMGSPDVLDSLAEECYKTGCLMALHNPPIIPDWDNCGKEDFPTKLVSCEIEKLENTQRPQEDKQMEHHLTEQKQLYQQRDLQRIKQEKEELMVKHSEEMARVKENCSTEVKEISAKLTQSMEESSALKHQVMELQKQLQENQHLKEKAMKDLDRVSKERFSLQRRVNELNLINQHQDQENVDLHTQLINKEEEATFSQRQRDKEIQDLKRRSSKVSITKEIDFESCDRNRIHSQEPKYKVLKKGSSVEAGEMGGETESKVPDGDVEMEKSHVEKKEEHPQKVKDKKTLKKIVKKDEQKLQKMKKEKDKLMKSLENKKTDLRKLEMEISNITKNLDKNKAELQRIEREEPNCEVKTNIRGKCCCRSNQC